MSANQGGSPARSMEPLRWMYTVAAGFALIKGVETLIARESGEVQLAFDFDFMLFIVFITFLIRFAHGALRYFDITYAERGEWRGYQPAVDFLGLFAEAFVFVFMAFSLRDHPQFAVQLLVLVVVDSVWLAYLEHRGPPFGNWIVANVFLVAVWIPVFVLERENDRWLVGALSGAALVHCIFDYVLPGNWEFYFGSEPPQPVLGLRRVIKEPSLVARRVLTRLFFPRVWFERLKGLL